jgi:glycerophosphoryl diester phosphodiesterase
MVEKCRPESNKICYHYHVVNVYKKFLHIIRQHAESLLLYEILMRSIGFIVGSLLVLLFDLAFEGGVSGSGGAGEIFINKDLLGFLEGYRLLFLTLAIFTILYVSLVEIVGLCYISAHEEKGAHILATLRYAVRRAASILHAYGLHVILGIFLCVFFFPIFDIGPAYLRSVAIPSFVTGWIAEYRLLGYAYWLIAAGIAVFIFRSAFTFHIFSLNKKNIVTSIRESWAITRRKVHVRELLKWGVIVPAAISVGMLAVTAGLSYVVLAGINAVTVALIFFFPHGVSLVLYSSWIYLLSTAVSLMIGPILISILSAYLLVRAPGALDAEIIAEAQAFSKKTETDLTAGLNVASNGHMDSRAIVRMLRKPSLVIMLGAISFLTFSYVSSNFLHVYNEKPNRPILISHRGLVSEAQENSIEAFAKFAERFGKAPGNSNSSINVSGNRLGIETDLQTLNDGNVVVYHDESLERLYDIDKKIINIGSADLARLSTSSAPIATMPELLDFLASRRSELCPALLEIKVYADLDSAKNTADWTIAEIRKHHLEACVYLGSLDARIVSYVESVAPNILSNQYVFTKAGDITGLTNVDAISLEYSLANEKTINAIKREGKAVFVWTLDSASVAAEMYAAGVDGIITDDPAAVNAGLDAYEKLRSSTDPQLVTLFGKTFLVDLKDVWQFKLRFPF